MVKSQLVEIDSQKWFYVILLCRSVSYVASLAHIIYRETIFTGHPLTDCVQLYIVVYTSYMTCR